MITDKGDYLEYYERDPTDTRKEEAHQNESASWVKHHYPEIIFWHTVNEGKKTITQADRDQRAGLLKGVSDNVFLNGVCYDFPFGAIELKRVNKSGKGAASPVSKDQKEYLKRVRAAGGFAAVAYGFEQFKLAFLDMIGKQHE